MDINTAIQNFLTSPAGQTIMKTSTEVLSSGHATKEYTQAVIYAEALYRITGAVPTITETELGSNRWRIHWEGEEKSKATNYFRQSAITAVQKVGKKEAPKEGVFIDFAPVLAPLAIKYGGTSAILLFSGLLGVGYLVGRFTK